MALVFSWCESLFSLDTNPDVSPDTWTVFKWFLSSCFNKNLSLQSGQAKCSERFEISTVWFSSIISLVFSWSKSFLLDSSSDLSPATWTVFKWFLSLCFDENSSLQSGQGEWSEIFVISTVWLSSIVSLVFSWSKFFLLYSSSDVFLATWTDFKRFFNLSFDENLSLQ